MQKLCILGLLYTALSVYSQNYNGYDVFDYSTVPPGFTALEEGYYYNTDGIGYFDKVYFLKNQGYNFTCTSPSAMKYTRIYSELVKLFGMETYNDDYIPNFADKNDIDFVASLITLGQAELYKVWELPDKKKVGLKYYQKKGMPEIYVVFAISD